MGYYIRVLAKSDAMVPVPALERRLRSDGIDAIIKVEEGTEQSWSQLVLAHGLVDAPSGGDIAVIERDPVEKGSLGEGEVQEFLEEVDDGKPESAAKWLKEYLPGIKVVYSFQILHAGVKWNNGWEAVHAAQGEIWGAVGGILQADGEGFSNEEGYHILWQFSDNASGPWKMAVGGSDGEWIPFEMDLGNQAHRKSFCQGKVPVGARRL